MSGIALRWTIGDVSSRGQEALRLSIWGAWKLFGPAADYLVCVHTLPVELVRARTRPIPPGIQWLPCGGGTPWELEPPRYYPDRHEICIANNLILWEMPATLKDWLDQRTRCLLTEDIWACYGRFGDLCGKTAYNLGLRGMPPGFDLGVVQQGLLELRPGSLCSREADERGLQVAALSLTGAPFGVTLQEVSLCSPFYPHQPYLGRCGSHFLGVNSSQIPWDYYGRPADVWMDEHWRRYFPVLIERVRMVFRR
ncbi:MAG: hypothetical protein HY319_11535 [Armatimonadetes bacterium]|nr:hypothetical protein [Armatimonadota bacterium]